MSGRQASLDEQRTLAGLKGAQESGKRPCPLCGEADIMLHCHLPKCPEGSQ